MNVQLTRKVLFSRVDRKHSCLKRKLYYKTTSWVIFSLLLEAPLHLLIAAGDQQKSLSDVLIMDSNLSDASIIKLYYRSTRMCGGSTRLRPFTPPQPEALTVQKALTAPDRSAALLSEETVKPV